MIQAFNRKFYEQFHILKGNLSAKMSRFPGLLKVETDGDPL